MNHLLGREHINLVMADFVDSLIVGDGQFPLGPMHSAGHFFQHNLDPSGELQALTHGCWPVRLALQLKRVIIRIVK